MIIIFPLLVHDYVLRKFPNVFDTSTVCVNVHIILFFFIFSVIHYIVHNLKIAVFAHLDTEERRYYIRE